MRILSPKFQLSKGNGNTFQTAWISSALTRLSHSPTATVMLSNYWQMSKWAKASAVCAATLAQVTDAFSDISIHPARSVTSSTVFVHSVMVSSFSSAYAHAHAACPRMMAAANVRAAPEAGTVHDSHVDPSLYYIDLLNPYPVQPRHPNLWLHMPIDPAVIAMAEPRADTWNWDTALNQNVYLESGSRTEDTVYVLYADGDEQSLTNMADILTGIKTPWTLKEALTGPQRKEWLEALKIEMAQLREHGTYDLVDRSDVPDGTPIVTSKIAWKLKLDKFGKPKRYKARCTARGFTQVYGVNFKESFQPVARLESVRTFIAHAVSRGLVLHQLDFANAYLQGKADYPIYMSFPKDIEHYDCGIPPGKVALLRKSIYGLVQAGFVWWSTLSGVLHRHGFRQCDAEPCCWILKMDDGYECYATFHVDDCLFCSTDHNRTIEVFGKINQELKHAIEPEPADWYLGMRMDQELKNKELQSVTLSQTAYCEQICKANGVSIVPSKHPDSKQIVHTPSTGTKLSVVDCPKVVTRSVAQSQEKFRSNVGAILFLARCTLPCIS